MISTFFKISLKGIRVSIGYFMILKLVVQLASSL